MRWIADGLVRVARGVRAALREYLGWAFGYEGAAPLRRAAGSGETTDGWTHPDRDTRTSSTGRGERGGGNDSPPPAHD